MTNNTKAQSAIEFTILVGFVMVFFAIFFLVIQESLNKKHEEKLLMEMQEVGLTIQNEINLATESMEGYQRVFTLPEKVYGEEYTLLIDEELVFVKTKDNKHQVSYPVQQTQGNITLQQNTIIKQNGIIIINP